jgi:hypothetical protein
MIPSYVRKGDEVRFMDSQTGRERFGEVTAFVADAGHGFAGFVCWDPIAETHAWGYLSQILEVNGEAIS